MGLGGSSLRLSGAAELHRTQPQGASFPCFFFPFSSFFPLFLFSPLFFFPFPFPSLSFPLFFLLLSFCFLLGVGFGAAWQRRFLCFLCFLCFQFPLSLLSAFAFSLAFVFCFSLRFLYIFSSFHFFLHIFCPWLGAYIGSHGV